MSKSSELSEAGKAMPRRKPKAADTSFLDELVAETPDLLARLDTPRPEDPAVPHLPISDIAPDPHQPRRHIDEAKLAELADAIEKTGILQPLVVRPAADWNGYVLVFGERRYRAALKAGLKHVPAFIRRDLSDADVLQLQWQENAQREDIDDIDKALHLRRMKEVQKLSWTQLADMVNLTRRHLLRMQRLADMPDTVTNLVRDRRLTPSHVYQIARLEDPARQVKLATDAAEHGWSVSRLSREMKTSVNPVPEMTAPSVSGDTLVKKETTLPAGKTSTDSDIDVTSYIVGNGTGIDMSAGAWESLLDALRGHIASGAPPTEGERVALQQISDMALVLAARVS